MSGAARRRGHVALIRPAWWWGDDQAIAHAAVARGQHGRLQIGKRAILGVGFDASRSHALALHQKPIPYKSNL
jgi:hypothetical protein